MMTVKVTDRDLRLLRDLYDNTFLSFYQIHDQHFAGLAKPTLYNRLAKLIKAGLVKSMPVNLRAVHLDNQSIGAIYHLTMLGLVLLQKYDLGKSLRSSPANINLSTLLHDLILTDVIRVLRKKHSGLEVFNTKAVGMYPRGKAQVPDAIMRDAKKDHQVAIELELTAKSEARYRDIIFNYRCYSKFEKVIYVVASDAIKEKISSLIGGGADTGMFSFLSLKELMDETKRIKSCNQWEVQL